jgi:hypothetical protein
MTTPDEFTAPLPSSTANSWAQLLAELRAYVMSNLAASVVTAWSVFLFAGGLVFLVYFWSIGFMPEIDAKAFVTLLAASALTGGCLFIAMSFYWVTPGYLWVLFTRDLEPLKSPWWFFLPMTGIGLTSLLGSVLIPKWWGIASILVFLIAPLPLFFPFGKVRDWISASPRQFLESLKGLRHKRFMETFKAVVFLYISLFVNAIIFTPLFVLMYNIIRRHPDLSKNLTSLVIANALGIIYILFSNFLVIKFSYRYQDSYKEVIQYIIVGTISLLIILIVCKALSLIPEMVMNTYKFGSFRNAFLVVDEVGCSIVHHHGITPYTLDSPTVNPSSSPTVNPSSSPTVNPSSSPKMTCSLSKVTILSRLGSTYYLIAFRDDETSVHFTMPGQNVLSWSVKE